MNPVIPMSMMLTPWMQRLAWTLIHFLWQGTLLGLSCWLVLTLLRRKNPGTRYGVACGFLAACAVLPLFTFFSSDVAPLSVDPRIAQANTYRLLVGIKPGLHASLPFLLVLWGLGVSLFSLRTLVSYAWLRRLRRQATEILDTHWQICVDRLRLQRGIQRTVALLESPRLSSPLTTGLWRPVILVPLGFMTSMDPVAMEAVLAHELAHVRRLDVLVIGLQTLIETLLFYHPAVWWISHRMRAEREHCCDDDAVKACGDAVLFAHVLNRLDALREAPQALAPGAGGGDLMERIKRLLAVEPGPVRFTAPGLSALVAMVLCGTTLAAQREPVQQVVQQLGLLVHQSSAHLESEGKGLQAGLQALQPEAPETTRTATFGHLSSEPALEMPQPSLAHLELPVEPSLQAQTSSVDGQPSQGHELLSPQRLGFFLPGNLEAFPADGVQAKHLPYENHGRSWKLTLPAKSKLRFEVEALKKIAGEEGFHISFELGRSLWVERPKTHTWMGFAKKGPIWTDEPYEEKDGVVVNPAAFPQSLVVHLSGSFRIPYQVRCIREALDVVPASVRTTALNVEPWPAESFVAWSPKDGLEAPNPAVWVQSQGFRILTPGGLPDGSFSGAVDEVVKEPLTHLRCLRVMAQPGESLHFKAWGTSEVYLEAITPRGDEDPVWIQAVQASNHEKLLARTSLKVVNRTGRPQPLILVLYRTAKRKEGYRVTLDRSLS